MIFSGLEHDITHRRCLDQHLVRHARRDNDHVARMHQDTFAPADGISQHFSGAGFLGIH